jgi:hypothetical protein
MKSTDAGVVTPKSNGHLLCELCSTYWCLHVEDYVKTGDDADFIWSDYPNPQQLEVPIIPTSNLWATVLLTKPENAKATMYRVEYFQTIAGDPEFIGFIHPGEGRAVMRSVLLDWFTGTKAFPSMDCTSRGHGFTQITRLQKDMKNPGMKIAQQWSIWATGKCLGCTFSAANNSDLVPDGDKKDSPW